MVHMLRSFYEMSIGAVLLWIVTWFPGPFGNILRYGYYRKRLKCIGAGVVIGAGVEIQNPSFVAIGSNTWVDRNVLLISGKIRVGRRSMHMRQNPSFCGEQGELTIGCNCHIAPNVVIQAHGGVTIGNAVGVASGAKVYSSSHHYRSYDGTDNRKLKFTPMASDEEQALIVGPVVLEDATAVGLGAVVLPGVTVGRNSWIGVLSCVSKDVPPDSIVTGCPSVTRKREY